MGSNNPENSNPISRGLSFPPSTPESAQPRPVQARQSQSFGDSSASASNTPVAGAIAHPSYSHPRAQPVVSVRLRQSINPSRSTNSAGSNIAGNSSHNTLPTGSQGNVQPVLEQPRQPRHLQGLLRFAMEATKAENALGNSEVGPLDDERRKFLEEALRSLTVNVPEVLDNAIRVLTNTERMNSIRFGESLPDEVKNAFTILLDYVYNMDVANDFNKMGGFAMFPICYSSENEEVRSRASAVLGTLCQNNPFCQNRALECGLLNVLLTLVQSERGTGLAKCLYAISCVSRGYEPACRELIAQGGCNTLARLLNCTEEPARTKAAFLVRYYCQYYSDAKEKFIKLNVVRTITAQIQSGRDQSTEHLLSILTVLTFEPNPTVLRQCRDPSIKLKKVLEDHLKCPELSDDRYTEEKEYCNEVLCKVFKNCPPTPPVDYVEEEADR